MRESPTFDFIGSVPTLVALMSAYCQRMIATLLCDFCLGVTARKTVQAEKVLGYLCLLLER